MVKDSDKKTSAFAERMTDILNGAALNLALSVGYRTGLFEAMDGLHEPAPLSRVARRAGLDVRYTKEWLGVMVCGGVVELSQAASGEDLYFFPPEHGDLLCVRAGPDNLGVYTQEIPLLTQCAWEEVLDAFRTGRGVPYANYPSFQDFMGQLAAAKQRQVLVESFLPLVDGGSVVESLKRGVEVCDVGCAKGTAVLLMARAFPESSFLGLDIDPEAVEAARREAAAQDVDNAVFKIRDVVEAAGDAGMQERFAYVTAFDAIHDQTRPMAALEAVYAMLRRGGVFSMVDIAAHSRLADNMDHPMGTFLYTVSLMHCMPVGLVDNGAGLGMMWGREKAVDMLAQAGFVDIEVDPVPEDPFNLHFCCRKP